MSIANIKLQQPHPAQQQILKSKAKRVTILAGRQFGKSSLCLQLCIKEVLKPKYTTGKSTGKYPSVLYITPFNLLARNFFKEFLTYIPQELIAEQNQTDLFVKLRTGGTIRFKGAESGGASFRGFRNSLIVCDEMAYYKNLAKFWQEDVEPSMTGYDGGRAYFISTPVGHNTFYNYYLKGVKKDPSYDPYYDSFHFTGFDNPYADHDFINKKKDELIQIVFEQEYLAIPSANASNPFGLNIRKNIIPALSKNKSEVYGIDLAKTVDYTVITGLATNKNTGNAELSHFDRFQGSDWNEITAKVKSLPRSQEKLLDSSGVGDPILDGLKLIMPNIKGFKFSKSTKGNLVREFIKAVEEGKVKYTQEVADEMEVFSYQYDSQTGYCRYMAQEGYHDDIVMSICLSWWQYNRRTKRNNNWCIGTA
ncbi:terminase large subunit domain-containing protein [Sphingobacterium multivorum]|uniref:terminase large subunit domain-containing protein n=1 Tax=Sphingobacterium multivorum TaxID=28454 RepID=UPI0028ABA056|nr:terminase family protein [Sphingobacterium multivorum]